MEQSFIFLILLALPTIFANTKKQKNPCAQTDICSEECLNRGFIQSQEKKSCDYPSFEYCQDKSQSNCSEEKIACTDLGFQKEDQSGICVSPTAANCQDQKSPGYCNDWQYCTYLGFDSLTDGQCAIAQNCTRNNQCESHMIACIDLGFSKNSQDNNCFCSAPLKEEFAFFCYPCKRENKKCSEQCIKQGWVSSQNKCVVPNCLAVKDACDGNKLCSFVFGYVAKSDKDKDCMIPKCDESNKNNCADSNHVCVSQNGFTKNQENSDCECDSKKIIKDNKCVEKIVEKTCKSETNKCNEECIRQGWVNSENKCVVPNCLAVKDACDGNKLCSVEYGYVAKSENDKDCVIPVCDESNKNNCADSNHVCVSKNGFTKKQESNDCECDSKKIIEDNKCIEKIVEKTCKSETNKCNEECIRQGWVNSENKCVVPNCLAVKDACDGNKLCSVEYGYVAKSENDKDCVIPACDESNKNNCADSNHVCVSQNGFTKKQESNDCECDSKKIIKDNKCIHKTSSIKLLFSLISLFLLILA